MMARFPKPIRRVLSRMLDSMLTVRFLSVGSPGKLAGYSARFVMVGWWALKSGHMRSVESARSSGAGAFGVAIYIPY